MSEPRICPRCDRMRALESFGAHTRCAQCRKRRTRERRGRARRAVAEGRCVFQHGRGCTLAAAAGDLLCADHAERRRLRYLDPEDTTK